MFQLLWVVQSLYVMLYDNENMLICLLPDEGLKVTDSL